MKNVIKFALVGLAFVSGVALAAPQTVVLTWNDAGAEDSYILQRQAAACNAVVTSNWATVAFPAKDVTSYTDTTANGGNTYCYRIAAVKAGVNQGWSNLHEVTVVDTIVPIVLSGGQV